jgi:hypothetical protein
MVNPLGVQIRSAALDAMHFIASLEEELREIRAVLTCDAGDEGAFGHAVVFPSKCDYGFSIMLRQWCAWYERTIGGG